MEIKRIIDGKEIVIVLTEEEVQKAHTEAFIQHLQNEAKDYLVGYTHYKKAFAAMSEEEQQKALEEIASEAGYELLHYSGRQCLLQAISKAVNDYCAENNLPADPSANEVRQ